MQNILYLTFLLIYLQQFLCIYIFPVFQTLKLNLNNQYMPVITIREHYKAHSGHPTADYTNGIESWINQIINCERRINLFYFFFMYSN